jgi:hypothetical protein
VNLLDAMRYHAALDQHRHFGRAASAPSARKDFPSNFPTIGVSNELSPVTGPSA